MRAINLNGPPVALEPVPAQAANPPSDITETDLAAYLRKTARRVKDREREAETATCQARGSSWSANWSWPTAAFKEAARAQELHWRALANGAFLDSEDTDGP